MRILDSVALALMVLSGCSSRTATCAVEIIDTTASITPQAEKAAFEAVRGQIARMRRGDRLVVMPITGDAENDAGGHILRLQAPTTREAYDADLRRFHAEADREFSAWALAAQVHQNRTDLLGTLDVARQEIAASPQGSVPRLIIVSDFLEDDGQYNFASDRRLGKSATARDLASHLRAEHGFTPNDTTVCLGRLESMQFASLAPPRKTAIGEFWTTYFAQRGHTPDIQLNGIGLLAESNATCPPAPATKGPEVQR